MALALLCTSKLALDERALARVLDLYLALLRRVQAQRETPGRRQTASRELSEKFPALIN
nr:hypothetical protein [Pseudomonas frederiksbergensis]